MKLTTWIKIITETWPFEPAEESWKMQALVAVIFFTWGRRLLQCVAIVAKKLLVDDKIAAFVNQMCLLGVKSKVSNRRTWSGGTFCFLKKRLLSLFKFFASSNLLYFYQPLIGPQPTSIGQLCLSGPGYSSCTVRAPLHVPSPWSWSLLTPVYNQSRKYVQLYFFLANQ